MTALGGFFLEVIEYFLSLRVFCGKVSTIIDFYGETMYAQK